MYLHIEKVELNFPYKLLADETVELVNRYLFRLRCLVAKVAEKEVGVFCIDENTMEIKNISIA